MNKKNDLSKLSQPSKKPKDRDEPNSASELPGWPGYRTRDGRSGYDPIDNDFEAAHVTGAFVQSLFTGKLRLRNRLALVLSGLAGLLLVFPLLLAITESVRGNLLPWEGLLTFLVAGLIGLALLVNFVKNLRR